MIEDPKMRLPSRLIPVTRWNDYHAWPPVGGLRHLIFHSKSRKSRGGKVVPENGLDDALVRVGRRVLIDEIKFFEWARAQNRRGESTWLA